MKKTILILYSFIFIYTVKAQDQLFKKNNTKISVKVMEIGINEIKYKPFDNLNGPVYVVNKNEVSLIIFENGKHEVIDRNTSVPTTPIVVEGATALNNSFKNDSLLYYKYKRSISINFFNFINNELGFLYQQDFYKHNFNIVIPFSIGIGSPSTSENIYYKNSSNFQLNRKLYEIGFGINYCGSRKSSVNYYLGPVIKFMQYETSQYYSYYPKSGNTSYKTIENKSVLSTFTWGITNGLLLRTKSRVIINLFASLGYQYNYLSDNLTDPNTQKEIPVNIKELQFYFWGGSAIGFTF